MPSKQGEIHPTGTLCLSADGSTACFELYTTTQEAVSNNHQLRQQGVAFQDARNITGHGTNIQSTGSGLQAKLESRSGLGPMLPAGYSRGAVVAFQ